MRGARQVGPSREEDLENTPPHHTQTAQVKVFRRIEKRVRKVKKKSHICVINFLLRLIKALIKQALLMETAVWVGSLEELEEVLRFCI